MRPFYLRTGNGLREAYRGRHPVQADVSPDFRGLDSRPLQDLFVFEMQPDEGIVQTLAAMRCAGSRPPHRFAKRHTDGANPFAARVTMTLCASAVDT